MIIFNIRQLKGDGYQKDSLKTECLYSVVLLQNLTYGEQPTGALQSGSILKKNQEAL